MLKKFNLALIPTSKNAEAVSLAAQFSSLSDNYLLGEKSLPHVTLYQFQAEEKEIESIWRNVCNAWDVIEINLIFDKFSCITLDSNIFWVSLLPNKIDTLNKLHSKLADILNLPIKKTYDPHMTLINTKNKEYEKEVAKISLSYVPIKDTFVLSLGASDEIGQLTEIIYRYDDKKTTDKYSVKV